MIRHVFAIATVLFSVLAVDPFQNGPYFFNIKHFQYGNITVHPDGAGMGVYTWTPSKVGEYPVLFFATGFGADTPSIAYSAVLKHVASWGYIVVSVDQISFPNPDKYVDTISQAVDWLEANLTTILDENNVTGVTYNFDKSLAVAAQSSGNHMVVSYLNNTCGKAKALVMIDPVDGADPFGIIKNYIITPGTPVNFKIPTLHLDNGLDPVRGLGGKGPACAPESLSNDRFYDNWNSPIWNINATEFGHTDCLDTTLANAINMLCPGHGGILKPYQNSLAGATVAFLDAVFRGKTEYLDILEDSANYPVENIMKHDLHGMPRTLTPYCTHD